MNRRKQRKKSSEKEKFLKKMRRHLSSPSVKELLSGIPKDCGTSGVTSNQPCIINSTFIPTKRSMVVQKYHAKKTHKEKKANLTCTKDLTSSSIRNILIQSKIATFKTMLQQGCDKKNVIESEDIFESNSDNQQQQQNDQLNNISLVKKLLVYGYNEVASAIVNPEKEFRNMKITTMDEIMEKLKNKLKKQCSLNDDGGQIKHSCDNRNNIIDSKFSFGGSSNNKKLITGRSFSSRSIKEKLQQHFEDDDRNVCPLPHHHQTKSNNLDETTNDTWEKAFKSNFEKNALSKKNSSKILITSHFKQGKFSSPSCTSKREKYENLQPSADYSSSFSHISNCLKEKPNVTDDLPWSQQQFNEVLENNLNFSFALDTSEMLEPTGDSTNDLLKDQPDCFNYHYSSKQHSSLKNKEQDESFTKSRDYSSYDISNLLDWKENNFEKDFEKNLNSSFVLPTPDNMSKFMKRRTDRPSSSYSSNKDGTNMTANIMEELFATDDSLQMNYSTYKTQGDCERIGILEQQKEFSRSFQENVSFADEDDCVAFDEITNQQQASNQLKRCRKYSPTCSSFQEWECKRSFSLNKEKCSSQYEDSSRTSYECNKSAKINSFKPNCSNKSRDFSSYDISFNLLNWKESRKKFEQDFQTNLNSPNDTDVKNLVHKERGENEDDNYYRIKQVESFNLHNVDDMMTPKDDDESLQSTSQLNNLGSSNQQLKAQHRSSRDYSSYDICNLLNWK